MWTPWIKMVARHRYFLLFILLFAYIESVYMRMAVRQEINVYTFTPEAAISLFIQAGLLFLIIRFFNRKWNRTAVFSVQSMLQVLGSSLFTFLLLMKVIGLVIALLFNKVEQNFNQHTFILSLFSDFLDGVIYGSFYLAYSYYRRSREQQQKEASYQRALSENRIYRLKAQLNPHFLFNNLNVLDQLIEEDKQQASAFLTDFADIYRYVLQGSDKKLVSLSEELAFTRQYFRLMQLKYPSAYQISVEQDRFNGYIVPLTLQLLIENVFQHNIGTEEKPVSIHIHISNQVQVKNNVCKKRSSKITGGRALVNLQEQYKLLTSEPVQLSQSSDCFLVSIPIIENMTDETNTHY